MRPTRRESVGAKSRRSRQRSAYSSSASPSSSSRMLEADTMEEERRLVRELPELLLSSDMGDMQLLRPDMELIPDSECE